LAEKNDVFRKTEDVKQPLKLFLAICFSAAFVAISAMSLLGTEWVPNWFLPTLVFGAPAFAILIVLVRSYSRKQAVPEGKVSSNE